MDGQNLQKLFYFCAFLPSLPYLASALRVKGDTTGRFDTPGISYPAYRRAGWLRQIHAHPVDGDFFLRKQRKRTGSVKLERVDVLNQALGENRGHTPTCTRSLDARSRGSIRGVCSSGMRVERQGRF